MDAYKVMQLKKMLSHETSESETHYGARLGHWWGDTPTLTIDAGGLKALIEYYSKHDTDLEGTNMNKYAEMKQRQQAEFNALPLGFAFSQEQFDEMMRGWGLDPEKDINKILSIGYGGYVQKKDADLLHATRKRHDEEMAAAIAADETGEGFIFEMFLYELDNHEFSYTMDTESTLDVLGYTAEQVIGDPRLKRGIEKAATVIFDRKES